MTSLPTPFPVDVESGGVLLSEPEKTEMQIAHSFRGRVVGDIDHFGPRMLAVLEDAVRYENPDVECPTDSLAWLRFFACEVDRYTEEQGLFNNDEGREDFIRASVERYVQNRGGESVDPEYWGRVLTSAINRVRHKVWALRPRWGLMMIVDEMVGAFEYDEVPED